MRPGREGVDRLAKLIARQKVVKIVAYLVVRESLRRHGGGGLWNVWVMTCVSFDPRGSLRVVPEDELVLARKEQAQALNGRVPQSVPDRPIPHGRQSSVYNQGSYHGFLWYS